jgi:hypothetical protein
MQILRSIPRLPVLVLLVAALAACGAEGTDGRAGADGSEPDVTTPADGVVTPDTAVDPDAVKTPDGTTPTPDGTDPADATPDLAGPDGVTTPADVAPEADAPSPDTTTSEDTTLPPGDGACPTGQCTDTGDGYLLCLDGGAIPAGNPTGCHASDTGCTGNFACLYTDAEKTQSACVQNCGECPSGTTCGDVTGDGYLGCLVDGALPSDAPTQCHTGAGCAGNATCFYTSSDYSTSACVQNCSGCTTDAQCGAGMVCEGGLCAKAPCTSDAQCTNGDVCVAGTCIPDIGAGPGPGPGRDCPDLPPLACTGTTAYCSELIQWEPHQGPGYDDYAINGETNANQYRSWLRRDMVMALQHVAAKVACKAADWSFGNGGAIGLGDMSEQNGAIPGTSINDPGHPEGTHTGGVDIDLGYFQVNTADNHLRPICEHLENGAEAYHCTATPTLLDPWRTALFMGYLFENDQLRVIGCDGKAGPLIMAALQTLCDEGWLSAASCSNVALTYEETNQGWGWFYFHHHHFHVSFNTATYGAPLPAGVTPPKNDCLVPGCVTKPVDDFLRAKGLPSRLRPVPGSVL